jgi:hypothetical protein
MAYCTIDELAAALRLTVDANNTPRLTACVNAAAEEIDAAHDRITPGDLAQAPDSPPLVNRDNLFRAVQWFKANDVALGQGGSADQGILLAPPESYVPQSNVPYKEQWGIA